MGTKQEVIEELRRMFKEGATPSRLIQHIVARHPREGNWHGLVQAYFQEAFGVPIVRGLTPSENYRNIDLRYAFLNEGVLHEMVQERAKWDQEQNGSENGEPSWLDSLVATSALARLEEANQAGVPAELSDKQSESERKAMVLANSGYRERTEMVHILARLVERLQQRIVALEETLSDPEANRKISS